MFSPEPAQTVCGFFASHVTQPQEYEPASSATGVQVVPEFSVRQSPPEATAITQVARSVGWTVMSATRPDISAGPIPRQARPAKVSLFIGPVSAAGLSGLPGLEALSAASRAGQTASRAASKAIRRVDIGFSREARGMGGMVVPPPREL